MTDPRDVAAGSNLIPRRRGPNPFRHTPADNAARLRAYLAGDGELSRSFLKEVATQLEALDPVWRTEFDARNTARPAPFARQPQEA
jgi:hypothetical protein